MHSGTHIADTQRMSLFTTTTIFGALHLKDSYLRDLNRDHLAFCLKYVLSIGDIIMYVSIALQEEGCQVWCHACPVYADASGLTTNNNHKQVVPENKIWLPFHVTGTMRDRFGYMGSGISAWQKRKEGDWIWVRAMMLDVLRLLVSPSQGLMSMTSGFSA